MSHQTSAKAILLLEVHTSEGLGRACSYLQVASVRIPRATFYLAEDLRSGMYCSTATSASCAFSVTAVQMTFATQPRGGKLPPSAPCR